MSAVTVYDSEVLTNQVSRDGMAALPYHETDSPAVSPMELVVNNSPIVLMMETLRQKEDSLLHNEKKRADLRQMLWLHTMIDEDQPIAARLRASELSAKADGGFIERKSLTIQASYREMVMSVRGKLKELDPLHRDAVEEMDLNEMIEAEVVDECSN